MAERGERVLMKQRSTSGTEKTPRRSQTAAPAMLASCREARALPLPRPSCCLYHTRREQAMPHWVGLHKGIVHRDHEDLASVLELVRLDVTGNMVLAAGRAESCRDTYKSDR